MDAKIVRYYYNWKNVFVFLKVKIFKIGEICVFRIFFWIMLLVDLVINKLGKLGILYIVFFRNLEYVKGFEKVFR